LLHGRFNAPRAYPSFYAPYYDQLSEFYDGRERWLESIKDVPQGAVHLFCVHWLHLEVHNGGFWQYFFNSTGVTAPEARDGFSAIGMPEVASVVTQVMDRLGSPYPFDRDARQLRVGSPDTRMDFDELETAFYDLADTERFFRKLPKFVPFADNYASSLRSSGAQ
jgi:Domain of unknown function (DUF4375)